MTLYCVFVCACVRACIRACVRAHVCVCGCAHVCVCGCAHVFVCVYADWLNAKIDCLVFSAAGLTGAEIAGIVIGVLSLVLIIIVVILLVVVVMIVLRRTKALGPQLSRKGSKGQVRV